MIGVSKLYCGTVEPSDSLRYGHRSAAFSRHAHGLSFDRKPVVVWNCTRACNLRCMHCYALSDCRQATDEMSGREAHALINDLAAFGVPVLLFSGGEPLCREDVPAWVAYASSKGLRTVLSTNGTLITDALAQQLKRAGLAYAGISLDGLRETNDRFRGQAGAFDAALQGLRACRRVGLKVGLRYTMTRHNVHDLPGIFDLIEAESIPRVCFYHMVYSGRARESASDDLSHEGTRRALDLIIDRTADLHKRGVPIEVLTVDNHCDGPAIYLRLLNEGRHEEAARAMDLLKRNGGNSSGYGIGCVSWDGAVYADQFLRDLPLGNVRQRPFSTIWSDPQNEWLKALRDKPAHVTGKCVTCRFLEVCGGNFRARAIAATGELWGVDPACYLTDEEIA